MPQRLKAVYRGGAFIPQTPCDVPDGSEVELTIHGPYLIPPGESDPQKRAEIARELVERMRQNPFPADAPRFTREELHERR